MSETRLAHAATERSPLPTGHIRWVDHSLVGEDSGRPADHRSTGLPFEYRGLHYTVERREGRVFQNAIRRDAAGSVLAKTEAEVRFALGSGTRGTVFLIERDGFLFQSPIAWFGQKGRWGIAPGYGEGETRPSFERPIEPECLFCHTNQVRHVAHTSNRYEPPIFEGHAIGCERCHGPGALHVERGGLSTEPDLSIVNPAHLAPALRDSVCQQCHLQGLFRFPRAGRDFFDFRPGLPLHRFLAVFVQNNGNQGTSEVAGQVEQLESSRCFRDSQGRLACTSCHDPHRLPAPSIKAAYYRERCLECHEKKGCDLPLGERQARGRGEDCIACHMPRPRYEYPPRCGNRPSDSPRLPMPAQCVRIGGTRPDAGRGRSAGVSLGADDRGGAAGRRARPRCGPGNGGPSLASGPRVDESCAAAQSLPLLEAAVRDQPDDLSAGDSLGYVLGIVRGPADAHPRN